MSKKLFCSACSLVGAVSLFGLAGCSDDSSGGGSTTKDGGNQADSSGDSGGPNRDGGSNVDGGSGRDGAPTPGDSGPSDEASPNWTYVLIDDMETTTHGPIELDAGITPPLTPGYWFNSGAQVGLDAGDAGDMSDPPYTMFKFTALPTPTTTLNGKVSNHAARQYCVLTGLYDTCGVGFEFTQEPVLDAGLSDVDAGGAATSDATLGDASAADATAMDATTTTDAAASDAAADDAAVGDAAASDAAAGDAAVGDASDAAPPIPRVTVPFDISGYKGITFWGMTTTPDPATSTLQVKVQFPDTDTDPRGEICNGGGGNTSECYNSYAAYLDFTTTWQQYTVLLDPGDGGGAPDGGIAIDTDWGYSRAQWLPTQVYGINWQAQKNTDPDAGSLTTELWIDDVYFVK